MKRKDDTLFEIFVIGGMEGKIFTEVVEFNNKSFQIFHD